MKESLPDETRADDQSEKEQRVEYYSHEFPEHREGKNQRESELQAELILLFHALDMEPSTQISELLDEVSPTYILLYHNFNPTSLTEHLSHFCR